MTRLDSGEILDDMVTRSRGEIRRTHSPKVTSSSPASVGDMKPAYSPRLSQRAYSPRVNELRTELSPRLTGKGLELKETPSPGPSILGKNHHGSSSS